MSTNVVGMKLHSSGWWGSKRKNSGGVIVANALGTPAPAARLRARSTAAWATGMVRVERVGVGVGDEHVGGELADHLGDLLQRRRVDLQRVVAEIEAVEVRPERLGRLLGLAVADRA